MKADLVAGFVFIFVSVVMYFESLNYSELGSIFPKIGAAGLFLFSIIYIATSLREKGEGYFSKDSVEAFVFTFVATIVYVGILPYLGFLLSGFLYITLFSYMAAPSRTKRVLLASIGFSVLINALFYSVFRFIFNVPLPSGLLESLGL